MASYAIWRAGADKGDHRRLTWVCGDQSVLVDEVVTATRAAIDPGPLDYHTYTAALDADRAIWARTYQHPLTPGASVLIVVRRAEKISSWEPLHEWAAQMRLQPGVHLLFVADTDDFPRAGDGLAPHIELIKTKGRIVRCNRPNDTDLLAWVLRRAPALDPATARHLLARTGGDLSEAADTCTKLAVLPGTPTPAAIDLLAAAQPSDTLADSLTRCDKAAALLAAATLGDRDILGVITTLAGRLDLLGSLWQSARAGLTAREVSGHPSYLVHTWLPYAKHYDPKRCAHRLQVLAVCDDAARSGARIGLAEALIALW